MTPDLEKKHSEVLHEVSRRTKWLNWSSRLHYLYKSGTLTEIQRIRLLKLSEDLSNPNSNILFINLLHKILFKNGTGKL